jgi:hypothetical protein
MFKIASLIFSIVGTTIAGIIITAMLSMPGFIDGKPLLLIGGGVAGFILALPVSILIAKAILAQDKISKI